MLPEQEIDKVINTIKTHYGSVVSYLKKLVNIGSSGVLPDTEPIVGAKAVVARSMLDQFHEVHLANLIKTKLETTIATLDEMFGEGNFILVFSIAEYKSHPGYFRLALTGYELFDIPDEGISLKVPYLVYSGENIKFFPGMV